MPRMKQSGRLSHDRGQSRSVEYTAWRKNRRFGQTFRGAAVDRPAEHIPHQALPRASAGGPIVVENRPHRDFFFPITGEEALERIAQLPEKDTAGITHLWLRRMVPKDERPFGSYTYWPGSSLFGPDYAVIILYPWPRSLRWRLGSGRPSSGWRYLTGNFGGTLQRERGRWYAQFTTEGARRFFLDDLILHEVGHHADWRRFSSANNKQVEDFANQYAVTWARKLRRQGSGTRREKRMTKADFAHLERVLRAAFPYWRPRIEHDRHDGPNRELTVSFRLFDRRGRVRSNTAWIRPGVISALTVAGAQRRVERANQDRQRRPWKGARK